MTGDAPDYSLLDRAGLAQVAFFPRPDHGPPPPGSSDHLFVVEPAVSLGARLYAADPTAPTILYFHGNGEVVGDHDAIAPFYREIGVNLLVVEFRGYGASGGQPTFRALMSDAREVARQVPGWLDSRGFSGARFVMGRSLGAHPALEIAANAPEGFRGLILESGAGSAGRWIERLPLNEAAGKALVERHEAKIRSISLPTLLIHGADDELVPLELAVEMRQLLAAVEPELVIIPGAGHNDIIWLGHAEYFAAIQAFVSANMQSER